MRVLQAATGLLLVMALAVYGFSLTIDTTVTTSDQNLVQFWAGCLLALAAGIASVPCLLGAVRRDRRRGLDSGGGA
jgi:hypothetical protein